MSEPTSQLTAERPDIWDRAVALATSVTGLTYVHKAPLPDGTIYACGGSYYRPDPPTPQQIIIRKIDDIDRQINQRKQEIDTLIRWRNDPEGSGPKISEYQRNIRKLKEQREDARKRKIPTPDLDKTIAEYEIGLPEIIEERKKEIGNQIEGHKEEIGRLQKERDGYALSPVAVPDGAMEWLLHEVGHWVASTPDERLLTNYGYGTIKQKGWGSGREWQAWAFEEIILAPFGPSRGFAPLEHRGGTAFDGPGHQLIPEEHLRHTNAQIKASRISIEQWRALYSEWIKWGTERTIYRPL